MILRVRIQNSFDDQNALRHRIFVEQLFGLMAKRLPNRCMSEIEPRNEQNRALWHELSKLQDVSLCASPSLKHVIKPNVVQMRKEAFEKISKEENLMATARLSVVNEKASCGRLVKSDSCIGLTSNQGCTTKVQEKLRSAENVDNLSSGTKFTAKQDSGGATLPKPRQTMSFSVVPSESNGSIRASTLSRRDKPQVQPKPNVMPKRFPSSGLPRQTDRPVESRHSMSSADDSDVFLANTKDVEKKPDSSDLKVLESEPSQQQMPSLPLRPDINSPPIPPPKPPRSLSEVIPMLDEGSHPSFAETDVDVNDNRYDRLMDTFSVVLPAVIPEMQPAGEIVTPHTRNNPVMKVTSEYEEVRDVIPAPTEVKKSEKGKKDHIWTTKFFQSHKKKKPSHSKTIQISNPNYGLLTDSDTERPLVRYSSDNALNRSKTLPEKELIYDVPYMVTGVVTAESRDCDSVCFDEGGYAIPDIENKASKKQTQVCLRANAHCAYIVHSLHCHGLR